MGIINIYTGLEAYHKRTLESTRLWTIIFTAQVSFITFLYLFQDKKEYIQEQGVILGNLETITPDQENISQIQNHKDLLPAAPCGKRNALRNLFDWNPTNMWDSFAPFSLLVYLFSLLSFYIFEKRKTKRKKSGCSFAFYFLMHALCEKVKDEYTNSSSCGVHSSKMDELYLCILLFLYFLYSFLFF